MEFSDTIAAIATPVGTGGIGIIRISGAHAPVIAQQLCVTQRLTPQQAYFRKFYNEEGAVIDHGIVLFFAAPRSFTGEHVVEIQGHGGAIVLDMILKRILALGARPALAGEFSERAFIHDKMDLTQAEAVADLISAGSVSAARSAMRSLQGIFSEKINQLLDQLIAIRVEVEASIDFIDEDIVIMNSDRVVSQLDTLETHLADTISQAHQGVLLREGVQIVIAGRPNVGKSSLMNVLCQEDVAIVTHFAGTTRDIIDKSIQLEGLTLHLRDTAGLRDSDEPVEKIGIQRSHKAMAEADHVLYLIDASGNCQHDSEIESLLTHHPDISKKLTILYNKIDIADGDIVMTDDYPCFSVSATQGTGMTQLLQHLKGLVNFVAGDASTFSARRRHIHALCQAQQAVISGRKQLVENTALELLAEELRQAQQSLNSITGIFTSDDLLGEVFRNFCIGK